MPIRQVESKNWRYEVNETALTPTDYDGEEITEPMATPFTTKADSSFADSVPKLTQTSVFIRRSFQGHCIEDIANELEVAPNTVASHNGHAVERLKEALALADYRQATRERYESLLKRNDANFVSCRRARDGGL